MRWNQDGWPLRRFHFSYTSHTHPQNVTESITKMFIEYSRTLFKYRGLHTRLLLYLFTATLTKYLYTLTDFYCVACLPATTAYKST